MSTPTTPGLGSSGLTVAGVGGDRTNESANLAVGGNKQSTETGSTHTPGLIPQSGGAVSSKPGFTGSEALSSTATLSQGITGSQGVPGSQDVDGMSMKSMGKTATHEFGKKNSSGNKDSVGSLADALVVDEDGNLKLKPVSKLMREQNILNVATIDAKVELLGEVIKLLMVNAATKEEAKKGKAGSKNTVMSGSLTPGGLGGDRSPGLLSNDGTPSIGFHTGVPEEVISILGADTKIA